MCGLSRSLAKYLIFTIFITAKMKVRSFILFTAMLLSSYSNAQKVVNTQDSLGGFNSAAINAFMLQNNLSSSEQTNYMARKKREFINSKYNLNSPSTQAFVSNNNNQTMAGNLDFEAGNLSGWIVTGAQNTQSIPLQTCCSAQSTPTVYNGGADPNFGFSRISPLGGNWVAALNTPSTLGQEINTIENTMNVSVVNNYLKIATRYVLEQATHDCLGQPFVQIKITDISTSNIVYNKFIQANESAQSYTCLGSNFNFQSYGTGAFYPTLYYYSNNWDVHCVDLTAYIGSTVRIQLTVSECSYGGHGGYAYFDVSNTGYTANNNIFTLNNTTYSVNTQPFNVAICTTNSAIAIAPAAATSYTWYGPVINGSTTQSVQINQAGSYTLNSYLPYSGGCSNIPNNSVVQFTIGTIANVSVAVMPTVVCGNTPVTFSMSGATSYSIVSPFYSNYISASTVNIVQPNPPALNTFSITGYNSSGCSATQTINIQANPVPTISMTNTLVCVGVQTTLTATGADTYIWKSGSTVVSTSDNYVYTPTGTSNFQIIGTFTATGCTTTLNTIAYANYTTLTAYPTLTLCPGNSVTVNAWGSQFGSYTWTPGNIVTTNTVILSPTVTTTYTLSSNNACGFISSPITLTVYPTPTPTLSGPISFCPLTTQSWTVVNSTDYTNYYFNGIINNYQVWPNISANVQPNSVPYIAVTGTNSYGCGASSTLALNILPQPSLTINNSSNYQVSICSGNTITLTAGGAISYTWNNSSNSVSISVSPTFNTVYGYTAIGANGCVAYKTTSLLVNGSNPTITPLAPNYTVCSGAGLNLGQNLSQCCLLTYSINNQPVSSPNSGYPYVTSGNYTLTVANSCGVVQATYNVLVNPTPTITAFLLPNDSLCNNNPYTATIIATGTNTYVLNGTAVQYTSSTSPIITFSLINYGYIYATVTNSYGCVASINSQYMYLLPSPYANIVANTNTFCPGSPVILTANLSSSLNTYTWSTNVSTPTISISPLTTTVVSVTSTGTNGCFGTTSKTLNPQSTSTLTISPSQTICNGSAITLTAGGASASYSWNTNSTSSNISVSPSVTSVYSVFGYSLNNPCPSSTISTTVSVIPSPTVGFTLPSYTVCYNKSAVITATGANSYYYPAPNISSPNYTVPFVTGNQTITVIGTGTNGCQSTATVPLNVISNPVVSINSPTNTICSGNSLTLTAIGANTYSWVTSSNSQSIAITPTSTTTYSVVGMSAVGCTASTFYNVNVYLSPTVTIAQTNTVLCSGNSATLTASGAMSYTWAPSTTSSSMAVTPNATTIYSVTGVNSNGCTQTTTASIIVNPMPTVTIGTTTNALCSGQSTTLIALGATNYTWTNGPQTDSFVITPSVTTTYSVVGSSLGCRDSIWTTMIVNNNPIVTVSTNTNNVCSGSPVILTANGASSYTWSNNTFNSTTQVNPPASTNVYSVTGANAAGCETTKTIAINTIPSPTVSVSSNNNPVCVGQPATITAVGATTYSWNNFSFNYFIVPSPTVNTTYTVTGTDPNGCYDQKVITQSVIVCTGISQVTETQNWLIFPNPTKDQFTVKLNSVSSDVNLEVYTMLGQLLFKQKLSAEINTIEMSKYANGIYYVKIKEGKKEEVVKLVKE